MSSNGKKDKKDVKKRVKILKSRLNVKSIKKVVRRKTGQRLRRQRSMFQSQKEEEKEERVNSLYADDQEEKADARRGAVVLENEQVDVVDVINVALELSLLGQKALIDFLFRDETQEDLANAGDDALIDSLESEFYDREAPTSVRGGMLWRFASTIWDFPKGQRKTNLKLALTAFDLLLEWCDPFEHPLHYAALQNSLEQAENAFHRVVLTEKLAKGNDETRWDSVLDERLIPRTKTKEKEPGLNIFGIKSVAQAREEERLKRRDVMKAQKKSTRKKSRKKGARKK